MADLLIITIIVTLSGVLLGMFVLILLGLYEAVLERKKDMSSAGEVTFKATVVLIIINCIIIPIILPILIFSSHPNDNGYSCEVHEVYSDYTMIVRHNSKSYAIYPLDELTKNQKQEINECRNLKIEDKNGTPYMYIIRLTDLSEINSWEIKKRVDLGEAEIEKVANDGVGRLVECDND